MRFSLRNQKKISRAFGEQFLQGLLVSLKAHFASNIEIEEEFCPRLSNGESGHLVVIPAAQEGSCTLFQFVVIGKTYNVFNLAYYAKID